MTITDTIQHTLDVPRSWCSTLPLSRGHVYPQELTSIPWRPVLRIYASVNRDIDVQVMAWRLMPCHEVDSQEHINKNSTHHYDDGIMGAMASQITSLTICLLNRLFRRRSKKISKLRVTGLCAGNSPATGEFPAQMASYAENVSIWWRHHDVGKCVKC